MTAMQWLVNHGGDFAMWLIGIAGAWLLAFIKKNISDKAFVLRVLHEVGAAVQEVGQTYVDALKESAKDGNLTAAEAAEAKRRAIEAIKSNIGVKGLERLGRILDIEDVTRWLTTRIESHVAVTKPPDRTHPFVYEPPVSPK